MAKSFALVLSAALAAVLVAGCAPADPVGQPTYSCTPEAGGTPYACYKVQRDELDKLDALYAEAEAVYRKYLAEDERIMRAGGVDQATPVMEATLSKDALTETLQAYKEMRQGRAHIEGDQFRLAWVKRRPDLMVTGLVAAVQVCVDASSSRYVEADAKGVPMGYLSGEVKFDRDGNTLKIAETNGEEVAGC